MDELYVYGRRRPASQILIGIVVERSRCDGIERGAGGALGGAVDGNAVLPPISGRANSQGPRASASR